MFGKNIAIALGVLTAPIVLVAAVGVWGPVAADDRHDDRDDQRSGYADDSRHDDDDDDRGRSRKLQLRPEVPPATHAAYVEECAACHMAYPAALLPAPSWQKMMGSLDQHFGENAELDAATAADIQAYLVTGSADNTDSWVARKLQRGADRDAAPQRISELPYFRHEHDEVPRRLVQDNPQVGSFSRCEACHQDAAQGMFDEHQVRIAGYGAWDD